MDIKLRTINDQPLVRVNIFKHQKHLDLEFEPCTFRFTEMDGTPVFPDLPSQSRWRIKVKQAKEFKYEYYLVLKEAGSRELLEPELAKLNNVILHHVGGDIYIGDKWVTQNDKYLLSAGPFASEREARHHAPDYAQINHCRVYRQLASEPRGSIEIFDPYYEIFSEVKNGLRLEPLNDQAYFRIIHYTIDSNEGHEKGEHQDLYFQGALEIGIDINNTLKGVNELAIEKYLRGVLQSELEEDVLLEYAKCMAIVARSQVFSRIGRVHPREGFDFCSAGHCLRYYGKHVQNKNIDQAIESTIGQILSNNGRVCETHFTYACGGHTENAFSVWLHNSSKIETAKYDCVEQIDCDLDLKKEADVRRWILGAPDVFCKPAAGGETGTHNHVPDAFRWEVFYTRQELEEIIREKTGEELGVIYEMIPISRGESGRIFELEILGSLKNVHIRGELNIRSALSEKFLNSSCFVIDPELDVDGVPINFTIIGAGMGHGVGLCKSGAAKMAGIGYDAGQIIDHYFNSCSIKRIY